MEQVQNIKLAEILTVLKNITLNKYVHEIVIYLTTGLTTEKNLKLHSSSSAVSDDKNKILAIIHEVQLHYFTLSRLVR